MENYTRVYDSKYGESGWARLDSKGQLILDNEFKNYRLGQLLVLKDDNFTIDHEETEKKINEYQKQRLQEAETVEIDWAKRTTQRLAEFVGVEFNWGKKTAKIIGVDVCSACGAYWDFAPMFKVGRRAELIVEKSDGRTARASENEVKNMMNK